MTIAGIEDYVFGMSLTPESSFIVKSPDGTAVNSTDVYDWQTISFRETKSIVFSTIKLSDIKSWAGLQAVIIVPFTDPQYSVASVEMKISEKGHQVYAFQQGKVALLRLFVNDSM